MKPYYSVVQTNLLRRRGGGGGGRGGGRGGGGGGGKEDICLQASIDSLFSCPVVHGVWTAGNGTRVSLDSLEIIFLFTDCNWCMYS